MSLTRLKLKNFRNFQELSLAFVAGFNVITGKNGTGKTSLLEALNILSGGRSFRTSDLSHIIHKGSDEFAVFGDFAESDAVHTALGVSRKLHGKTVAKLQGNSAKASELALKVPVRTITPVESSELINAGPNYRRDFIDWGVFHVKHHYAEMLKRFYRMVKQRNAALKQGCSADELEQWNQQFALISREVDIERQAYLLDWEKCFLELVHGIEVLNGLQFKYQSGWDESKALLDVLHENAAKERAVGHGLYGPQRADLVLTIRDAPAKELLSRGQQKLCAVAMYLAQGLLLQQQLGKHPIYLVDDFTSELDEDSQAMLLSVLKSQEAQIIVTALSLTGQLGIFCEQHAVNIINL